MKEIYKSTWKITRDISTSTEVFVIQVHEHTLKMVPYSQVIPFLLCSCTFILFWLQKTSMNVERSLLISQALFYKCLSFGDIFIFL